MKEQADPFDRGGFSDNELTLPEIKEISSSMGDLLWLAFSGGEIFLREDIAEITDAFYKNNRPAIILFPTNGLLTGIIRERMEKILKNCPRSTIVLKLSIEGMEEVHDSLRGKGSFAKTLQTYHALSEFIDRYPNFELGVNTVFMSANQGSMDGLMGFVSGLDRVRTHTVSMIRGEISDSRLRGIDPGKYYETIKRMESEARNRDAATYRFRGAKLKTAQDILQRRLIYKTITRNKPMIPCYAGRLNLVLTERGDVYPCENFTGTMKMGNVRDDGYDVMKILKTPRAQRTVDTIKGGCFCTHECYTMTNILFNPWMYPALIKEYLRL